MDLNSRPEFAENKLAIMYMIRELHRPMPNSLLMESILEGRFMTYIDLQETLASLEDQGYIKAICSDSDTEYLLTSMGEDVLTSLGNLLTPYTVKYAKKFVPRMNRNNPLQYSVSASYESDDVGRYVVRLSVNEPKYTVLDVKFSVHSQENAIALCDNFEKNPNDIAYDIIQALTKKREGDEI